MEFNIREATEESDYENYYRVCFPLFKEKFYADSEESDEELFKKHKEELSGIDFTGSDNCLYVAHTNTGEFAGR